MNLLTENHSMYPRVGESEHYLRLRRAYHRFDRGDIDEDELHEFEDEYVEEVIGEQIDAGLDIVTDGMIRWYDHVSHLAGKLSGTEVGGLVRFFDTNYLVREARVTGRVHRETPLTVRDFEHASGVSDRPVKAVLTGPCTLAHHSILDDGPYGSIRELAEDYATVLRDEVRDLDNAGARYIQIEEPSLLQHSDGAGWTLDLIDGMIEGTEAETRLATYFGDAEPLLDELQQSAVDVLTFDVTYSDGLEDRLVRHGSDKGIGLGLLDGRNTKIAPEDELVRRVEELLESLPDRDHYLTSSCSIEYLPRDRALRKLRHLASVAEGVREGVRT